MTDHTIYIGTLKTNQPLINLSGSFEQGDFDLAFTMIEDLFFSGDPTITFDCSGVVGVDKEWIENELSAMERRFPGLKIHIRKHFETPQMETEAETASVQAPNAKPGILDRVASQLVRLFNIERDISSLNRQTS